MTAKETRVTLVNVSQTVSRELILQMGAYGEHQCTQVLIGNDRVHRTGPDFHVRPEKRGASPFSAKDRKYR
jgi:hypothetical protein